MKSLKIKYEQLVMNYLRTNSDDRYSEMFPKKMILSLFLYKFFKPKVCNLKLEQYLNNIYAVYFLESVILKYY